MPLQAHCENGAGTRLFHPSTAEALVQLWSPFGKILNFADSLFGVNAIGYIDESLDGKGWFCSVCVITSGLYWTYFTSAWRKVLRETNKRLQSDGRKPIRRFHATDLWSRQSEFEGWSSEERDSFAGAMRDTIGGLDRGVHAVCHAVQVSELADVFGLTSPKQIHRACYAATMSLMLLQIAEDIDSRLGYEHEKVSLFHDQNDRFDAAISRAFWRMKKDESFVGRHYFETLTPCAWQDCVPLQAADFVVYETRRNIPNIVDGRDFGPHLKALLNCEVFGGSSFYLNRQNLESIRDLIGVEWLQQA